ncbi:hypothetical protein FB45DRAFT_67239 [Roridomyces roridus]|uniref:F-box domain-containing protein n=1 Tax=Roridomyces roridus TaxID=1738132 RepID=A0AAD7BMH5_9AGAR|nr:hypothetical protein FB45DRAFT_67239 [Roridomyces roridus]
MTGGCPNLSVLRLRGVSMHFFRPPLTHSPITTLYLEQTHYLFIGYSRFRDFLTASPALAHLSIHDTLIDEWEEEWPPDSVGSIPVPNLVSLRISIPGTLQHVFSDVLLSISAPKLESLVLKEVPEVHLDRFFQYPGVSDKFPSLRSLTFCDFDYRSEQRVAKMCAALPSVTEFTCIHSPIYPPKILEMMAGRAQASVPGSPTGDPWPLLRTLNTTIDVGDLELVRLAVERRKEMGLPLCFLRINPSLFEEEMDEEEDENLTWLQEHITVEPLVADRWPPGSDYDPVDDWFP